MLESDAEQKMKRDPICRIRYYGDWPVGQDNIGHLANQTREPLR
jgi:hypothetical protein